MRSRKEKRTSREIAEYEKAPRHKKAFIFLKDSQYDCLSNQETEKEKKNKKVLCLVD